LALSFQSSETFFFQIAHSVKVYTTNDYSKQEYTSDIKSINRELTTSILETW